MALAPDDEFIDEFDNDTGYIKRDNFGSNLSLIVAIAAVVIASKDMKDFLIVLLVAIFAGIFLLFLTEILAGERLRRQRQKIQRRRNRSSDSSDY